MIKFEKILAINKSGAELEMGIYDNQSLEARRHERAGDWLNKDIYYSDDIIPTKLKNRLNRVIYRMYEKAGLI
jgi:hypothetical protein